MSFSFKQLFKKDGQDYGTETTRLQFDQPQEETAHATDRNPQPGNSDGLSAEGVFTAAFSRTVEELPPDQSRSLPEGKSPFQIAESDAGNPEFSGEAFSKPGPSSDPAFLSGKESVQGEGDVVKEEVTGLFNSVPPCADVSATAGFFESVMETDVDTPGENPDPSSPGFCSSGESSVMEGGLPPVQRNPETSTMPGDLELSSSVPEPFREVDPEATRNAPSPFGVGASDVSTAADTAPVRDPVGENTVPSSGEDSSRSGQFPFPATGSMPDNPQAEDAGFTGPFGETVASEHDTASSSGAADEPTQPPGFPPRPTDVARSPEMGTQEDIPAFLEDPDSLQDEGPANSELSSDGQPDEGQFPGIDRGMPNIPEFPPPGHQSIAEPRPDFLEPGQQPVSAELPPMVDREKEPSVAGPWPFEDEFVQPNVNTKQPEPLESLSPLSPTLSGSPGSFDPVVESKAGQDEPLPIGDCNIGSSAGQATLRAFLMTDGDIDGDMVVRHCAELDGIHQCVVYTADGRIKSSSMPNGTLEIDGKGLLESVRNLASAFAAGSEGPVTLRSPEGLVSFFSCTAACLGVLHSEGALKSGVQERLRLITGALGSLSA